VLNESESIAFVDLLRLIALNKKMSKIHWQMIDDNILEKIRKHEIGSDCSKPTQNLLLITLKFLTNLYSGGEITEFLSETESFKNIVEFCIFCFTSPEPKIVSLTAMLLYNARMFCKASHSDIQEEGEVLLDMLGSLYAGKEEEGRLSIKEDGAIYALLVTECKFLHKNINLSKFAKTICMDYEKNRMIVKKRFVDYTIKEAVDDIETMLEHYAK
jgi:hypothetical protein